MNQAGLFRSLFSLVLFFSVSMQGVNAQTLIGGVTVNDSLIKQDGKLSKMSGEKSDNSAPSPKGDCVCFDRLRVEARQVNGTWKIVDGDHWMLDFASDAGKAQIALDAIKSYKMNQICFVGRDAGTPLMYFLADGQAPVGPPLAGEDSLPFENAKIRAEQIRGTWKLTCGDEWMADFGSSESSAKDAAEKIKYYGFTRQCFVGRPGPAMNYFVK